jgi:CSLREA domain-containing protein
MSILRLLFTTALFSLGSLPSYAAIIGREPFDYPDGPIAGQTGGTLWDYKNTAPIGRTGTSSVWSNLIAAPTVTSGQLVTSGNGAVKRAYNGNTETTGAINELNVARKVYYRVSVTTGPSVSNADYFGISSMDFGTEKLYFGKRGGSDTFGVEEVGVGGTNGGAAFTIAPNMTYTLVAIVDFTNNFIRLHVNPDLNAAEPGPGMAAANRAYTGTNWSTAVRFASGTAVSWDDLVVCTEWEDLASVTVTTTADEDNGSLGGGAGVSLREAVKYARAGQRIVFNSALSGQTITLNHSDGDMLIPQAAEIDATALPGGLTVSGNNATRHFDVQSGKSLTLRGLTFTRGNGSGNFGGSIVSRGTLNLFRCTFSGNSSNDASFGQGGAVDSIGTLRATDCTISDNTATITGGGVSLAGGTAELSRCTISGNTSGSGAALYQLENTTTTLSHCTVAGNHSTDGYAAGGIAAIDGTLTLKHCTISQNTGTGGLYMQAPATVSVANSIIAGNANLGNQLDIEYYSGTLTASGTNLIGNNTSVETLFQATANLIGTGTAHVVPKLSPLGSFGGPVQTMHPLIGSPAIDAAGATNPGGTDARGFPRFVDGDGNGTAQLDIGAMETGPLRTVVFASDSGGPGTLRNRINESTEPGARINFLPGVNFPSQTITLALDELTIPATANGLFIDASNLSAPVTISGNHAGRVFNVPPTSTLAIHSLRITGGTVSGNGGGILIGGTCTVLSSTISGNSASSGGGIANSGTGAIHSSTISGNSGQSGSGIFNSNSLTIHSSTLSGNSGGGFAENFGGGISNSGTCTVHHSTLSANSADSGGGIVNAGTFRLVSSIVAGNIALVSEAEISGTITGTGNLIGGNPLLAPLSNYGGPTQTMPPLPGSPAIDAAGPLAEVQQLTVPALSFNFNLTFKGATTANFTGQAPSASAVQTALSNLPTIGSGNIGVTSTLSGLDTIYTITFTGSLGGVDQPAITSTGDTSVTTVQDGNPGSLRRTDQRGFPIVGLPDIGAAEYQGSPDQRRFWATDWDGDGNAFGIEHALGTDPRVSDRANPRNLTAPFINSLGRALVTFGVNNTATPGTRWVFTRSTDLHTFTEICRYDGTTYTFDNTQVDVRVNGTTITVSDLFPPLYKAFYRLEAPAP